MQTKTCFLLFLAISLAAIACLAEASGKWSYADWSKDSVTSWHKKWNIVQWPYPSNEQQNVAIVQDPLNKRSKVLRIKYPKGSWNPSGSPVGGVGFYAKPISIPVSARTVTLTYQVFFPHGFNWKLGGKLPGLYGGRADCSGGNSATTCFSTRQVKLRSNRLMWRPNGEGEMYAYIPKNMQVSNICNEKDVICNSEYGYSFGRGSFSWKPQSWNTVTQTIHLNTVGKKDGTALLQFNGKTAFQMNSLVYRESGYAVAGIDFETFFGGSDSQWATPETQYTYFKGFQVSYQ